VTRRGDDEPEEPWHNRTSTLLAASVAGLLAIVVLVFAGSWVMRQFDEPEQAPLDFVDPSYSATPSTAPGPSTTQTITSTRPPTTTDIDPALTTPGSETTTPSTPSPSESESGSPTTTESSGEDEPTDDPFSSTTRSRPRYNVTRTLYPGT
jgi:hypothetical protein